MEVHESSKTKTASNRHLRVALLMTEFSAKVSEVMLVKDRRGAAVGFRMVEK
jgi:hypothetical protein